MSRVSVPKWAMATSELPGTPDRRHCALVTTHLHEACS